ncbi:MAG: helix-turn-helix transcriptional regulator [Anaerolineae bacterium]|nr:helix-turn-helix transcriptional regulator [Anaerolineae bacterium]
MSTKARREREKEERRRSLIQAARETFFENGFHHATVDSVAERAEVSKGTVYLYFESKEALLAHLLLEGLEDLIAELGQAYSAKVDVPADEQLAALARAYLAFFRREPHYFPFLMAMDRGRFQEAIPSKLYQEVLEASLEGLTLAVRVVQRGCREGVFARGDAEKDACVFWASLNGVLQLMEHPLRREMVGVAEEVLYQATIDTLIRGLKTAAARQ